MNKNKQKLKKKQKNNNYAYLNFFYNVKILCGLKLLKNIASLTRYLDSHVQAPFLIVPKPTLNCFYQLVGVYDPPTGRLMGKNLYLQAANLYTIGVEVHSYPPYCCYFEKLSCQYHSPFTGGDFRNNQTKQQFVQSLVGYGDYCCCPCRLSVKSLFGLTRTNHLGEKKKSTVRLYVPLQKCSLLQCACKKLTLTLEITLLYFPLVSQRHTANSSSTYRNIDITKPLFFFKLLMDSFFIQHQFLSFFF